MGPGALVSCRLVTGPTAWPGWGPAGLTARSGVGRHRGWKHWVWGLKARAWPLRYSPQGAQGGVLWDPRIVAHSVALDGSVEARAPGLSSRVLLQPGVLSLSRGQGPGSGLGTMITPIPSHRVLTSLENRG